MNLKKLQEQLQGQVFSDQETLSEVQTDFGRVLQKVPKAVVVPASVEDVKKVIQIANQEGWTVSTRGASHSQSGQSLSQGGILLDLSGLNRISVIEEGSVWVEAGTLWSDLVSETSKQGLLPRVLTNNLNVTVGGTLSMAGLGVASHRYGTQADNVIELEVVTGEGLVARCSATENSELFDSSRCGLGQFSIITSARVQLRRAATNVRTFFLLYDNLPVLMKDHVKLIKESRFDYIESWCTPCPQGFRSVGGAKMPFAEWFYPMQLTVEYDGTAPGEDLLTGLNHYRLVHQEDSPILEFVHRLEPLFQLWRQSGAWNLSHPWMEVVLPWEAAANYIQGVLKSFPPNLLLGGHVLLWPCRGETSKAPLFMHPGGDFLMGFGILPAVPKQLLPMALPMLNKASDLCMQMGGKRYLSGWVEFDYERWEAHFGAQWPQVQAWKKFYDPNGILNPGFIEYSKA